MFPSGYFRASKIIWLGLETSWENVHEGKRSVLQLKIASLFLSRTGSVDFQEFSCSMRLVYSGACVQAELLAGSVHKLDRIDPNVAQSAPRSRKLYLRHVPRRFVFVSTPIGDGQD